MSSVMSNELNEPLEASGYKRVDCPNHVKVDKEGREQKSATSSDLARQAVWALLQTYLRRTKLLVRLTWWFDILVNSYLVKMLGYYPNYKVWISLHQFVIDCMQYHFEWDTSFLRLVTKFGEAVPQFPGSKFLIQYLGFNHSGRRQYSRQVFLKFYQAR